MAHRPYRVPTALYQCSRCWRTGNCDTGYHGTQSEQVYWINSAEAKEKYITLWSFFENPRVTSMVSCIHFNDDRTSSSITGSSGSYKVNYQLFNLIVSFFACNLMFPSNSPDLSQNNKATSVQERDSSYWYLYVIRTCGYETSNFPWGLADLKSSLFWWFRTTS